MEKRKKRESIKVPTKIDGADDWEKSGKAI